MRSRISLGVTAFALATAFAACSGPTADEHLSRADAYRAGSQLAEAVIEYRAALQVDPQRGDIRVKLAEVFLEQRNLGGALREFVRAADLLPNDAATQVRAGSLLLLAGQFEDAKARADKAAAADPSSTEALLLRANALAGLKDLDGALSQFQEAIALNPNDDGAYAGLGAIQLAKGDTAAAEAAFHQAVKTSPDSVAARLALANFLWANRRPAEAEQELKAAYALDAANVLTNRALGTFYLASNRALEAEPHFKALAEMAESAGSTDATVALSDYYLMTGRTDDARQVLQRLSRSQEHWATATTRLAGIDAAQGLRAEATTRLREVLDRFPDDRAARLLLARVYLADGKRDEALAEANTIVEAEPNSPVAPDAFMVIGQVHARLDRPEAAVKAFEEALARSRQPLSAALALARLHLATGRTDTATTYIQQALQAQPGHPVARSLLVTTLLAERRTDQARTELASLQRDFPNAPAVVLLQANQQLAEGQLAAARASFERAAAAMPSAIEPLAGLVQLDLRAGRPDQAIARVEEGLKRAEQSSDLLIVAARTYAAANNLEATEDLLKRAIQLDPGRLRAYSLLAQLYIGQRRLPEAETQFRTMVERNPTSVSTHTMLGMIYDMQGKLSEAEDAYVKALAIDRTTAVAANNLAYRYAESNRNLDEALQLAQTAQQRLPNEPNVADTLGWVYYRRGLTSQAVRELESAVKLNARDPLARFHLGMAYNQAGEIDKARTALREALALSGDFAGADEARKTLQSLGG